MKHIHRGIGPPTFAPTSLGQHYVDMEARTHYTSVGTDSTGDWHLGDSGGGTKGPVSTVLNAQAHLLSVGYNEWLRKEMLRYIPPGKLNPDGTFVDPTDGDEFSQMVAFSAMEHQRHYSSAPHLDLTRGTRHIHNVKDKEQSQELVGTHVDDSQIGTLDVYPIARAGDTFQTSSSDYGTVFWSDMGELFVSDRPERPTAWDTDHLRLILEPGDRLQRVGINNAGYVFALSQDRHLYYGQVGRSMSEITDWVERGIDDVEGIDSAFNYGLDYAGAQAGHYFIMGGDRRILFTPDSGTSWKFVDVDMALFEPGSAGYQRGEALVFQGEFYYIVHEFDSGSTTNAMVVLKFDSINHTWSKVHRTAARYSRIVAYTAAGGTRMVISDDRDGSAPDAKEGLQTTDGVTFTTVDLTDTSDGRYFYFSDAEFKEIGNATYRSGIGGIIHRSVDGLHWDFIGEVHHDNGSGFKALPHTRPVSWADGDECACFISYSTELGFSLWAYEPGREALNGDKLIPWYQGTLDLHVHLGVGLKGYGYTTGGDGDGDWGPMRVDPYAEGAVTDAAFDVAEYGLMLQLDGLPFGIDYRLIRATHYVPSEAEILQSIDHEELQSPLREPLSWADSPLQSEITIGVPVTMCHPQHTTYLYTDRSRNNVLGNMYYQENPGDNYLTPTTDENVTLNLTLSAYAFNMFATCAIKSEVIPLAPRMSYMPS